MIAVGLIIQHLTHVVSIFYFICFYFLFNIHSTVEECKMMKRTVQAMQFSKVAWWNLEHDGGGNEDEMSERKNLRRMCQELQTFSKRKETSRGRVKI